MGYNWFEKCIWKWKNDTWKGHFQSPRSLWPSTFCLRQESIKPVFSPETLDREGLLQIQVCDFKSKQTSSQAKCPIKTGGKLIIGPKNFCPTITPNFQKLPKSWGLPPKFGPVRFFCPLTLEGVLEAYIPGRIMDLATGTHGTSIS